MTSQGPILQISDVSLVFGGVRALSDVSFSVQPGELFSIIGPNGAGKTSMLNCISGRYQPTTGSVSFKGQDVTGLSPMTGPSLALAVPSRIWRCLAI